MLLFYNDFQTTEVLLGIAVAISGSTTEALKGLIFLTSEPEGDTQGVLGTFIVANSLQQAERLAMAVDAISGEQLAGLVDGGCCLVGNIVEIDADITGVSLIFQDVLLDVFPRLTTIEATELTLPGDRRALDLRRGR